MNFNVCRHLVAEDSGEVLAPPLLPSKNNLRIDKGLMSRISNGINTDTILSIPTPSKKALKKCAKAGISKVYRQYLQLFTVGLAQSDIGPISAKK